MSGVLHPSPLRSVLLSETQIITVATVAMILALNALPGGPAHSLPWRCRACCNRRLCAALFGQQLAAARGAINLILTGTARRRSGCQLGWLQTAPPFLSTTCNRGSTRRSAIKTEKRLSNGVLFSSLSPRILPELKAFFSVQKGIRNNTLLATEVLRPHHRAE